MESSNSTPEAGVTRRDFAAAIGAGLALPALLGTAQTLSAAETSPIPADGPPLDLAEWSYFWVGAERADLARGSFVGGKQMYVEYWVPTQVKHPYPMVLVHGGGGQGTDWIGTPDGRRGWASILVEQGYKVYVVDRPGHGRSPFHPETHGPFPATAGPLEGISGRFTPPNSNTRDANQFRKFHNQWPGTGEVGSPDLDQFVASQGGSYVSVPPPPGTPAGAQNPATAALAHTVWRERGAMLLDKIGPAIIMTHSAGGPFGWLVAEIRPKLVKGIVAVEGGGQPFGGANVWGMSTIPVAYDPPVSDPSELKLKEIPSPEPGVATWKLQEGTPRRLKNLQGIPIVLVTSEGSFASPGNPGGVAYFKQAGCTAEELRLVNHGIHGNGHMMMVEKNNREVLQPILAWVAKNVEKGVSAPRVKPGETAMKLSNHGFFWVGTEHKTMPYGTILRGQMYVQYLIPAEVRRPYPVVLVHGGGGQMLHYMGLGDGMAGWAHYYVQQGYKVYLVDRPGHGRAPYHPDALGPIGPNVSYAALTVDTRRSAHAPNRQWPGTGSGDAGDPLIDQLLAAANAAPQDNVMAHGLWATRGGELLDKIGPAIVQVHSAGGPFSWIVANARPKLVKAIVNVEGGGAPFGPGNAWGLTDVPMVYDPPVQNPAELADGKPRGLKNLQGIPIAYVTAERSGRTLGPGVVEFLKKCGCDAEDFQLKDHGVLGNGHFMMMENNRKQVFEAIRGWVEQKVKA